MTREQIEQILRDKTFTSMGKVPDYFYSEAAAAISEAMEREKQESVSIIQTLMAYGNIRPIRGVRYVQGTHGEFLERASLWLDKNRILPPPQP